MAPVPRPVDATAAAIDAYWSKQDEAPRPHMGASVLGHPCERWIWLSFRWAVREHFDGRMRRLLERGKREEAVFVEYLRQIGCVVSHTGEKQMYVQLAPHVAGSIDAIIESGVPGAEKTRHIAEFKTHSLKSFNELKSKGVFEAKRRHWCQMQCYMHGAKIDRALYMAVCKDNDELYTERIEYSREAAEYILKRAVRLTLAERMPPPLSADPSWWQCKFCPAWSFCHETHCIKAECVNCRTCAWVTPKAEYNYKAFKPDGSPDKVVPVGGGVWQCENIPLRYMTPREQLEGCSRHVLHPDFTPWTLCGKDGDGNGIFMIGGEKVTNGLGGVLSVNLLDGERKPREEVPIPYDSGVERLPKADDN